MYPGRAEQARALGVWASLSSTALPAAPLLGGLLVDTAVVASAMRAVPPEPGGAPRLRRRPHVLAWASVALWLLALALTRVVPAR
jgi:hypothetical protein